MKLTITQTKGNKTKRYKVTMYENFGIQDKPLVALWPAGLGSRMNQALKFEKAFKGKTLIHGRDGEITIDEN